MIGRLPLSARRLSALALVAVLRRTGRAPVLKESVLAIMELTGLGTREAYAAAARSHWVQYANAFDWKAFRTRSRRGLLRDLAKVRGDRLHAEDFDDERSVVLGGVHAGSLPLAVGWLAATHFPGWPLVILKRGEGDADETGAQSRLNDLGVPTTVLTYDWRAGHLGSLRAARRRTLILCMVDLPAVYGKPRSGRLFWREAVLASGAVDLARICHARLLLFSSRTIGSRELVRVAGPIDIARGPGGAAEGEQLIDRWITDELLRDPGQWHNWDRVQEYRMRAQP